MKEDGGSNERKERDRRENKLERRDDRK